MLRVEFDLPSSKGMGEEAQKLLRPALREFVQGAAGSLSSMIRTKVGGRGRGRTYTRSGRTHQASAPGEPPARDVGSTASSEFGSYADSWDWDTNEKPTFIEGRIGSSMWKNLGRLLEYGTSKMRPRPHVKPAVEVWKKRLERDIANAK